MQVYRHIQLLSHSEDRPELLVVVVRHIIKMIIHQSPKDSELFHSSLQLLCCFLRMPHWQNGETTKPVWVLFDGLSHFVVGSAATGWVGAADAREMRDHLEGDVARIHVSDVFGGMVP